MSPQSWIKIPRILLFQMKHYQSEGGTDKGVSATILAEDKNNETHALLSEKAITEVILLKN